MKKMSVKKRILTCAVTMGMVAALTACGQSTTESTSAVETETVGETEAVSDKNETKKISDQKQNMDLKVIDAYVYDEETTIIVENTGDRPILDFAVAYINFDENGFPTTSSDVNFERGKVDAANLMPGEKQCYQWYGATGKYAAATVSGIRYSDGEEWVPTNLNAWAKEERSGFDVAAYKEKVKAFSAEAQSAMTNDYINIDELSIVHGNEFSTDQDINFTFTNKGTQDISEVSLFVLEFDKDGFPVPVTPYDTYCKNGHATGGSVNLVSGASISLVNDLFLNGNTTSVKATVYKIKFRDDTEWVNPYFFEWLISENASYNH